MLELWHQHWPDIAIAVIFGGGGWWFLRKLGHVLGDGLELALEPILERQFQKHLGPIEKRLAALEARANERRRLYGAGE